MLIKDRSLKSLAITGSIWTLGGYGTSQVIRLGSHLVLAWLLTPQIFGLMALVKSVQVGLSMFSDVGIKPSIIQNKRGDDPIFLNTAWTIQICRGIVLWVATYILSGPIALLFSRNDPAAWQLSYILPIAALSAVLNGFNSTALATLNRNLHLGRITVLELSTQVISIAVMISWALISPTVWSMVMGGIAGAGFRMFLSHRIVPGHKVSIGWNRYCASELFKFGKWIFLSTLFNFFSQNLDKLVLGNLLTLGRLGLYSIAFSYAKVAMYVSGKLGNAVLFPVYSKFSEDPDQMLSVANRSRKIVLWVGMALSVCFAIAAPLFFETLLDPRYQQAGTIAQWVALYIWVMIMVQTVTGIPLALGNSQAVFISNIWRCSGILLATFGYFLNGIAGFIVGLSFGPAISQIYLLRQVQDKRNVLLKQSLKFTMGTILYGLPAVIFTNWVRKEFSTWFSTVTVLLLVNILLIVTILVVWGHIRSELGIRIKMKDFITRGLQRSGIN